MPTKKLLFSIMAVLLFSSSLFAQIEIKEWGQMPRGYTYSIEIDGNLAYYADGAAVNIADISDPTSPKVFSSVVTPATVGEIIKMNNFLYIANWDAGLTIVDVGDPNNPNIAGRFGTGMNAWNLSMDGNLVFLANDFDGLRIIDVGDPYNPTEVSVVSPGGRVEGSFVDGSMLYVVTDSDSLLSVYDIGDPANPAFISNYNYGGVAWNVIVMGDYAFLADQQRTTQILNVSDPTNIFEVDTLGGKAYDFSLRNNLLYVIGYGDIIHVYDVSDPLNGYEIGWIDDSEAAEVESYDVTSPFDGSVTNYSFIAAHSEGFRIYNTNNLNGGAFKVAEIGGGYSYDVDTEGGFAFLADRKFGLRSIDLSDSRHPQLAGELAPGLSLFYIDVEGSVAFGLGGNNELV